MKAEPRTGFDIPFLVKLQYAGFGAVAALVVGVVGLRVIMSSSPHGDGADIPAFAVVSPQELKSDKILFSEMEQLFSNHLTWVTRSNGDMGVGVAPSDSLASGSSAPLIVRVTVLKRRIGEQTWSKAWNTDVLMRREQLVEVTPNDKSGNKMALWVYPLGDGKWAVDTNLLLEQPVAIASRVNMVALGGQPADIAQLRAGNEEYRVLQTVQVL